MIGRWWHRLWFATAPQPALPLLRAMLPAYLVVYRLPEEMGALLQRQDWPVELMVPSIAYRLVPLPFPLSDDAAGLLRTLLSLAAWCATLGLFTRPALLLFTLGYAGLRGFEFSWGHFDHESAAVIQVLFVLTFAPGVTAYSAGGVLRWWYERRRGRARPFGESVGLRPVPVWGMRLILVIVMLGYLGPGISKVRHGGLRWMNGETLAFFASGKSHSSKLQQFAVNPGGDPACAWRDGLGLQFEIHGAMPAPGSETLTRVPGFFAAVSVLVVLFEVAAPLVLLRPIIRSLYLLGAIALHAGVYVMMNIPFFSWIVVNLALIDWPGGLRWLRHRVGPGGPRPSPPP